jgi:hypothetical protein
MRKSNSKHVQAAVRSKQAIPEILVPVCGMGVRQPRNHSPAQGNALGQRIKEARFALKGRNSPEGVPACEALSGLVGFANVVPGRCPGLTSGAPLGRSNGILVTELLLPFLTFESTTSLFFDFNLHLTIFA